MRTRQISIARAKPDDRLFFSGVAFFFVIFVFAGFARTFYLHTLFRVPAPSAFLQFHGALMTGWILLLAVQATLIWIRRTSWHRRVGAAGAAYAALIIPIGCMATVHAAQREVRAHNTMIVGQLNVLGLELTQLLLFGGFVGAAIWLRDRPAFHKRLMLLATLCILPNVIVRLSLLTDIQVLSTNFGILALWTLFTLSVVAIDTYRNRTLHQAFGWGAFIAIAALYVAWAGSRTAIWDHFWTRLLA